ncbi:anaphase-promoting complex subunit 13 [Exaiptasia diaphana]|uniref:Anaphase-promoting complex subunit 13 n=1 Tax=Exaiptasia diaphana TaxID=2652724 RepID=A0A913WVN8_EXADI|nr:anaphase-promoting complex subunit 13 [Exaiptasia diaphana]KXJ04194.1 Anaphase-promoting complex subunit 13 [Exaiptasia diaphana]
MSKDSEFSHAHRNGRLIELIDDEWKKEKLPNEEIAVPEFELPPVDDTDNNGALESLKEQEEKWTDLGITQLQELNGH